MYPVGRRPPYCPVTFDQTGDILTSGWGDTRIAKRFGQMQYERIVYGHGFAVLRECLVIADTTPIGDITTPNVENLRRTIICCQTNADTDDREALSDAYLGMVHETGANTAALVRYEDIEILNLRDTGLAKWRVGRLPHNSQVAPELTLFTGDPYFAFSCLLLGQVASVL
jgi:hypothetical protein